MSNFYDSSSDSDDSSVENFDIPVATQPLPPPQLQALRIRDHVLVTLDYEKDNYGLWSRGLSLDRESVACRLEDQLTRAPPRYTQ
jgi:hypothetical protein